MALVKGSGQEWIRTTEGISQQIYSLPRLATSVPTQSDSSQFTVACFRFNVGKGSDDAVNHAEQCI